MVISRARCMYFHKFPSLVYFHQCQEHHSLRREYEYINICVVQEPWGMDGPFCGRCNVTNLRWQICWNSQDNSVIAPQLLLFSNTRLKCLIELILLTCCRTVGHISLFPFICAMCGASLNSVLFCWCFFAEFVILFGISVDVKKQSICAIYATLRSIQLELTHVYLKGDFNGSAVDLE